MHDHPENLTHYCSSTTLLEIFKNKKLWLTSMSAANDSAEGNWGLDRYLDLFEREANPTKGHHAKIVLDWLMGDRTAIATCFSEERDLLSQWRGYGDNGAGFSISFCTAELNSVATGTGFQMRRVAYQDFLDAIQVRKLFEAYTQPAIRFQLSSDGIAALDCDLQKIDYSVVEELYSIKNPAFSEEKEWRLLGFVEDLHDRLSVEYRDTANGIAPYIKLPFPQSAIKYVTLGPTNSTPVKVVEDLLNKFSINAQVLKSSASYR